MCKISFCIPCYRSENTIGSVIAEIEALMARFPNLSYEIVCAVDGSPDQVLEVLVELAKSKSYLKIIDFTMNFGQASARLATLRYASGDYLICLDDDGQCPVERSFELIKPLEEGFDLAIAKYPKKKQSVFKNFGSKINEKMIHFFFDISKDFQMSNFYAMRSLICAQILNYHNPYPYITGLLLQTTRKIAAVPMLERPRLYGQSGYTLKKLLKHWLDGATNFSVRPLRVADFLGLFCAALGFLLGLAALVQNLGGSATSSCTTSILAAIFFVGGLVMLFLGIIGEYVGRIYISLNNAPQYVIRQLYNLEEQSGLKGNGQAK